ncbi:hypothetical protein PS15m_000441 [Mucor circinelloides]
MPCIITLTSTLKSNSASATSGTPDLASTLAATYSQQQNGGKNCLICGSFVHMTRNCPVSP